MHFGKGGYILCEECSTQLNIVSDYSVMRVCHVCGCVNQKHEPKTKVAVNRKMPEDLSVIQIGAKAKLGGEELKVLGRYRIETSTGYYNLWTTEVSRTGELAWIIDSLGEYVFAMAKQYDYNMLPETAMWTASCEKYFVLPELGSCRLITRTKPVSRSMEGEIGSMPVNIASAMLYELRGDDEHSIFIIKMPDATLYYLGGKVQTWESFSFNNIRNIEITGAG